MVCYTKVFFSFKDFVEVNNFQLKYILKGPEKIDASESYQIPIKGKIEGWMNIRVSFHSYKKDKWRNE